MAQYKTVAGPVGLTIKRKESYTDAVKQYAAIIDKEAVGGWELAFIQEIPVLKNPGCGAALLYALTQGILGRAPESVTFNMLVFVKQS